MPWRKAKRQQRLGGRKAKGRVRTRLKGIFADRALILDVRYALWEDPLTTPLSVASLGLFGGAGMVDGWAERGYLSLRALFGPRPLTPTDHPYPTLWNSPTLLEPTEAPPPGSAKAKALQSLNRIRVRVYDSFLRRAGAKSVDDLVLSTDGQPDSPWCWAVNYCELGGPLEERRRDLLSRFDSEDKPVWVPLIGAVR